MSDFDLRAKNQHILCCAGCGEPVAGTQSGTKLELRCGYCGKDDVREIAPPQAVVVERVYRGRAPGKRRKSISLDMQTPPEGLERFKRLRKGDRDALAKEWRASLELPRDDEDASAIDQRIAFLGLSLAAVLEQLHHDALRARATLETTLLNVRFPAFRGLVLTRLASLAVRGGAPDLAEHWLDQVPSDVRVAELSSARRVTRALVHRARKDFDAVLEVIGQGNTADEFLAPYRWTAVALRMDAHEHRGEHKMAYGVWNQIARSAGNVVLATARLNALAPLTRKRITTFGFFALGTVMLVLGAAITTFVALARNEPVHPWLLGVGFASFLVMMIVRWRMLP